MSGMPWPIYHAWRWDDWSTVWDWVDAGGDETQWLERTGIMIKVIIPATMMMHTDLIVKYVQDNYYSDFSASDLQSVEQRCSFKHGLIYEDQPYDLHDWGDDEQPDTYTFRFSPGSWWWTWRDMCDTSLCQLKYRGDDTGILKRAWDEDAVMEMEVY